jgi:hypothetical protein
MRHPQQGEEPAIGTKSHPPIGAIESLRPISSVERAKIRDQMERVVASPLFRNSKRYTSLLRFAVEHRLNGDVEGLKERLLGIEVFGRDPDYNTTQDPVVRTSAVEVRKRLAEYYQQPGHESEIRIELPAGCYVPEFHTAAPPEPAAESATRAPAPQQVVKATSRFPWWTAAASLLVLAAVAMVWWRVAAAPAVIERFWRPVAASPAPVLFSVAGAPPSQAPAAATLSEIFRSGQNAVPLPDLTALVNIAGYLKKTGKPQRIEISRNIQFQDLKAGPSVIIGPLSPRWKGLLAGDWRFSVERDDAVTVTWIRDRQKPNDRTWSVDVNAPADSTADVYALVTRAWNETLGQTVVSIAGLSSYGTTAAGEFLSDPAAMETFAAQAPKDWERRNIQVVMVAKRVGTSTGRPRVAAAHFW